MGQGISGRGQGVEPPVQGNWGACREDMRERLCRSIIRQPSQTDGFANLCEIHRTNGPVILSPPPLTGAILMDGQGIVNGFFRESATIPCYYVIKDICLAEPYAI